jgi:hypothetical protein
MFIVDLAADFRKVSDGSLERVSPSRLQAIEVNRLDRQIGRGGNPESVDRSIAEVDSPFR